MSLKAVNLSVRFKKNDYHTFKDINFDISNGRLMLVKGGNGKGKTTLLNTICGAVPTYFPAEVSGEISHNNKSIMNKNLPEKAHIFSLLMQDPDKQICFPYIEEELFFGAENLIRDYDEVLKDYKMLTDLFPFLDDSEKETSSLSFGQKKILLIASLVIKDSEVYLFDEPGAGISEDFRQKTLQIINYLKGKSKIVIIAEHDSLFDNYADCFLDL